MLIHPFSSLLSAYGMGLADIRATRQQALEEPLDDEGARGDRKRIGGELGERRERRGRRGQGVPRGRDHSVHRARAYPLCRAPTRALDG